MEGEGRTKEKFPTGARNGGFSRPRACVCCILSKYLNRYPVYVLFHGCICVSITLLTMTLIINRQSTSEVSKGGQGQRSDSLTPHVSFSTVFQSACGKRLWILKLTRETSLRTGLSSLSQLLSKETKLSKLTLLLIS